MSARMVRLVLVMCALLARTASSQEISAQDAYRADSLRALLGAQSALQQFENRWRTEITSQSFESDVASFAQCETKIGDYCYGPRNGRVGYTWNGTAPNATRFARDLVPSFARKKARTLVTRLLETLKSFRDVIPADQWIAGQLVRLNLDRGDPQAALDEALDCTSDAWWCNALLGHVFHMIGIEARADSIWTATLYRMPLEERCRWLDPTDVISSDSLRRAVAGMDCATKTEFAERLWWLSDPLYLTPGNERRSEHLSRQVALLLDAFSKQRLDSTRVDMIVRGLRHIQMADDLVNGRPATTLLARDLPDITRSRVFAPSPLGYEELVRRLGVPGFFQSTRPEVGTAPQLVALFPTPRYAFIPAPDALLEPTRASPEDWWTTGNEQYEFHATGDRVFVDIDHQIAFFRRGDSAVVIAAADVENYPRLTRGGATAALIVRRDYTDAALVWKRQLRTDLYIQRADIPDGRSFISMEILSKDNKWAGRVRFGAGPPVLPGQRVSMSDIMFVESRPRPPLDLSDAEPLVLGTLRIKQGTTIGVFWEMYGLASGDSARYSIAVLREQPGLLGRVGRAIVGRPDDREPFVQGELPARSGSFIDSHAINLDLKNLGVGRYTLSVSVRVDGQRTVESLKPFEIVPR
jgi:hypothetical protein